MFHGHDNHFLQPVIEAIANATGLQKQKLLLVLASRMIAKNPNFVSTHDPWYTEAEQKQAIELLKTNGLKHYINFSARCKRSILLDIATEYKKLKHAEAIVEWA